MNKLKWNHFHLLPSVIADGKIYEIIVYADENKKYYFFGNSILWCLGYDQPHVSLQLLVPDHEQHKIPLGNGIFLDELTVKRLITQKRQSSSNAKYQRFENWFKNYLSNCKGTTPSTECPR